MIDNTAGTEAGQWVLFFWNFSTIVKEGYLPVLHVSSQLHRRIHTFLTPLNGDSTTFQGWASAVLSLFASMEKLREQEQSRFYLQVDLAENLKMTNVQDRVWGKILRM